VNQSENRKKTSAKMLKKERIIAHRAALVIILHKKKNFHKVKRVRRKKMKRETAALDLCEEDSARQKRERVNQAGFQFGSEGWGGEREVYIPSRGVVTTSGGGKRKGEVIEEKTI